MHCQIPNFFVASPLLISTFDDPEKNSGRWNKLAALVIPLELVIRLFHFTVPATKVIGIGYDIVDCKQFTG
jgi:hypothetical protein